MFVFGKYDWLFFPQYRIFIKFFVFSFSPGYRAFWSSSYLMLQFKAAKHYKGHVIEGKIEGRLEVKEGRRKRRNQLLGDITENRGYWKLKEETLDHPLSWTRFGRGYRPVVRQTTEWMNEYLHQLNLKEENWWSTMKLSFAEYSRVLPVFIVIFL